MRGQARVDSCGDGARHLGGVGRALLVQPEPLEQALGRRIISHAVRCTPVHVLSLTSHITSNSKRFILNIIGMQGFQIFLSQYETKIFLVLLLYLYIF